MANDKKYSFSVNLCGFRAYFLVKILKNNKLCIFLLTSSVSF